MGWKNNMSTKQSYTHVFDYGVECQRKDAPKENVGAWLHRQAETIANQKYGGVWGVSETRFERENETNLYYVTMVQNIV